MEEGGEKSATLEGLPPTISGFDVGERVSKTKECDWPLELGSGFRGQPQAIRDLRSTTANTATTQIIRKLLVS